MKERKSLQTIREFNWLRVYGAVNFLCASGKHNILQIKRCVLMGYFWIKVKIVFEFF